MQTSLADDSVRQSVAHKTSWKLIPVLLFMYFVCYLDRVNISYAALQLNADIGLSEAAYGFGAGIFFVAYVAFQVPANVMLTRLGSRKWLGVLLASWGTVAALMASIQTPQQFFVLRFILGVTEAGFFPAMIFYLTSWFPSARRGRIMGMAIAAAPLSGLIGGPLSTWLMQHTHELFFDLRGWQSMFIIEALPAIAMGIWCFFRLPQRPETADWLTPEEKALLLRDLQHDAQTAAATKSINLADGPLTVSEILKVVLHPLVLSLGLIYLTIEFGEYALAFFLPLMVNEINETASLGLSLTQIGLLVAIPSIAGAAAMIVWGKRSDIKQERIWHIVFPALLGAVAIIGAGYSNSLTLSIAAFSIAAAAIFSCVAVFWVLPSLYLTGAQAAIGIATINAMGNFAGLLGSSITGALRDYSGNYQLGLWVIGFFLVMAAGIVLALDRHTKR